MKTQVFLQCLLVASVSASQARHPVRLARTPVSKYTNTSIQSTTYTFVSSSISTADLVPSDHSDHQTLTLPTAISTKQSDCIANSTVTYLTSVYPTVYVTVESSYEVTVTASNVSITDAPTIFETPATACVTTVVSSLEFNSPQPAAPAPSNASQSPGSRTANFPVLTVAPMVSVDQPTLSALTLTSTVTVTKKTPVPVVEVPQDTNPPVTFAQVPTTNPPQTTQESQGHLSVATPTPNNNNNNGNPSTGNNNGGGGNYVNVGSDTSGDGTATSNPPMPSDNNSPTPTPPPLAGAQAGASKLGQIIDSIINSPFVVPVPAPTPATLTSPPAATPIIVPTIATINGIPVTINAPNVIVGGSVVTIPTAAQPQVTVQVNGQTFTVQSDQIIAPGTTYDLTATSAQNIVAIATSGVSTQSASIVTANGIILTVGPTQAIISGNTYQIGPGAPSTQVNINGQTLSIGNNGVAFPSTTFAPGMTIAENKFKLVTAEGLTFSIDASEAVISGTTYAIGSGAKQSTIVIGSQTVTIGLNGLVLASTTINPTSVPTISVVSTSASGTNTGGNTRGSSGSHSTALSTGVSSTGAASMRNSASSGVDLSSSVMSVLLALGFGIIPVFIRFRI